jgi:hypothetical protein
MPGILFHRQPERDYCTPRSGCGKASWVASLLFLSLGLFLAGQAPAQMTHAAKTTKPQELRAVGVLEWIGEAGKPSASRLIPVAIFTGDRYQDAGVYLARPEPLAVQPDTEYELQQGGVPKGRFDVYNAASLDGIWYGYGKWKPLIEAPVPHLTVSRIKPEVVKDSGDPDRPHFSNSKTSSSDAGAPPAKPADAPAAKAGSETHVSSSSDDPDRPKLRKRPTSDMAAAPAGEAEPAAEDPDRPKMQKGKTGSSQEAEKLTGTPPNLQQMVGLSTTTSGEDHPFAFQWANPEDEHKMQASLEKIARDAFAAQHAPVPISTTPKSRPATTKTAKAPAPTGLVVDDFRSFEISYSGGSTLVFTAHTLDEGTAMKYITIIAQPDFYGAPRVLLKQVTDGAHLDVTPRMRLIDAADTNGDHKAEFIFELRGKGERQFAIYNIAGGRAEQVFVTGSLP